MLQVNAKYEERLNKEWESQQGKDNQTLFRYTWHHDCTRFLLDQGSQSADTKIGAGEGFLQLHSSLCCLSELPESQKYWV